MKKIISILLALCLCIGLCACGGNSEPTEPVKSIEAQKADELILAIGEVSLEKESAVLAAKAYYDTLTDEQKAKVENNAILESAIESIEGLKLEQQYTAAVSYEDAKNPMAAKVIYESLPQDYKDVAERVAKIEGYLSLEGTWLCDNENAVGSDGKTYKPRYDTYDVFLVPGWKIIYNGEHYGSGRLPFETTIEAMTINGLDGFVAADICVNEDGLYEVGQHGKIAETNAGFNKIGMTMYFDAENQTLKVVYVVARVNSTAEEVTIEYTYHKYIS